MLRDNPWEFVENSLLQVKEQGCSDIQWSVICGIGQFLLFCRDMFIDPSLRPHCKKLFHLYYGYLEAFKFSLINSILNYRAWVQYHLLVREGNEVMLQKLQRA